MTLIHLLGPQSRARAKQAIDSAPDGFECEVKPRNKTKAQEDLFHARLQEFAASPIIIERYGKHHYLRWKDEIVKAHFGTIVRPSLLEPEEVVFSRISTRRLTVKQYSDLIEKLYSIGAARGHVWKDHRPDDYAEARVSERRAG